MADDPKVKGPSEGPSGYNGKSGPSSAELKAPVKIYPGASKLPSTPGKGVIDGPGCGGMFDKK